MARVVNSWLRFERHAIQLIPKRIVVFLAGRKLHCLRVQQGPNLLHPPACEAVVRETLVGSDMELGTSERTCLDATFEELGCEGECRAVVVSGHCVGAYDTVATKAVSIVKDWGLGRAGRGRDKQRMQGEESKGLRFATNGILGPVPVATEIESATAHHEWINNLRESSTVATDVTETLLIEVSEVTMPGQELGLVSQLPG